jgi:hypothetical protein
MSFTDRPVVHADHQGLMSEISDRCPGVFLVCFRSKNKNVVVYEAVGDRVHGYWLILEPSYREERRKKGILHDREEFGLLDHQFAWYFIAKSEGDGKLAFQFGPYPDRKIQVMIGKDGSAKAFYKCPVTKRVFLLRSMYIQASEQIYLLDLKKNVSLLYFNVIDVNSKQADKLYIVGGPQAQGK